MAKLTFFMLFLASTTSSFAASFNCMDLFDRAYENQNFGQIKLTEAHYLATEGQHEIAIKDYRNAIEYFEQAISEYHELPQQGDSCTESMLNLAKKNTEVALRHKQGATAALYDLDCHAKITQTESLLEQASDTYHQNRDPKTAKAIIEKAQYMAQQFLQQVECRAETNQATLQSYLEYTALFKSRLKSQTQYQQCQLMLDELLLSEASAKKTSFTGNNEIMLEAWLQTLQQAKTVLVQIEDICSEKQKSYALNVKQNAEKKTAYACTKIIGDNRITV